ncbi:MAG: hypothetical protein ACQESR_16010 [Planctomycetota bacterium]
MPKPTPIAGRARGKLDIGVGERLASEDRGSLSEYPIGVRQSMQPTFSKPLLKPLKTIRPTHAIRVMDFTWLNRLDLVGDVPPRLFRPALDRDQEAITTPSGFRAIEGVLEAEPRFCYGVYNLFSPS